MGEQKKQQTCQCIYRVCHTWRIDFPHLCLHTMRWPSIADDIQGAVLKMDKDEHDNGLLMKAQSKALPVIVQHKTAVAA